MKKKELVKSNQELMVFNEKINLEIEGTIKNLKR